MENKPNAKVGALAVYKRKPAKILSVGEKIKIELEDGGEASVRPKDIEVIHSGPVRSLSDIGAQKAGDPAEAWALMSSLEEGVPLSELSELVYGQSDPQCVLSAWRLVDEGLYFQGTVEAVKARPSEQVEKTKAERRRRLDAEAAWQACVERLRSGSFLPEDAPHLTEVESLARGRTDTSRVLRELSIPQTPESAHSLLLRVGRWTRFVNPHPARLGLRLDLASERGVVVPEESRMDLTHLDAFAIDDESNTDPDDAVSIDGDRLWIHVADPAACVAQGSELDTEARLRAVTLYLPERIVPMLSHAVVQAFGLGLADTSPALSFGIRFDADASIKEVEIVPSRVKVRRLSYAQAEGMLDTEPFASIMSLTERRRQRRRSAGAVEIDLPETQIKVVDGQISISELPVLRSRSMVEECMLAGGEAASRFAITNGFALPFVSQPPPDDQLEPGDSLATMFKRRRCMKRNRTQSIPGPHAGLGLESYARATSPLRRYADLLAHQQIRAYIKGESTLSPEEVDSRITATEQGVDAARRAERVSDAHWTLAYLLERPDWRGEAVLVDRRGGSQIFLIPSLAYEARTNSSVDLKLDDKVELSLTGVDLPFLAASFAILTQRNS